MRFLQLRSHGRPARFNAIIAQWRKVSAVRRPQHVARPYTWQSPALTVVGSATGTSWCPCASLIASRTPPASKSRATAKFFRWRGGMHAEIASFRSLTGGESGASGLCCYKEAFAPCLGRQESFHDGVCASGRSAAYLTDSRDHDGTEPLSVRGNEGKALRSRHSFATCTTSKSSLNRSFLTCQLRSPHTWNIRMILFHVCFRAVSWVLPPLSLTHLFLGYWSSPVKIDPEISFIHSKLCCF